MSSQENLDNRRWSGTGAVAREAAEAVGSAGIVVGVDAAIEMLGFARRTTTYLRRRRTNPGTDMS